MPVQYNPQDAVMVWPEADYQAVLEQVQDATSKPKNDGTGNKPMQILIWTIYHSDGREQTIKDYIVIPAALFKLKQLAIALGKRAEFEAGKFQADDNVGCNVVAELLVESSAGYDDKNKIGRIKAKAPIVGADGQAVAPRAPKRETVPAGTFDPDGTTKDDDIPF